MTTMLALLLSVILIFITLIKILDEVKALKEDFHTIRIKIDRLDKLQKRDFDSVLDSINMLNKKMKKFNEEAK